MDCLSSALDFHVLQICSVSDRFCLLTFVRQTSAGHLLLLVTLGFQLTSHCTETMHDVAVLDDGIVLVVSSAVNNKLKCNLTTSVSSRDFGLGLVAGIVIVAWMRIKHFNLSHTTWIKYHANYGFGRHSCGDSSSCYLERFQWWWCWRCQ